MAGQPRRKAEEASELAREAFNLAAGAFLAWPKTFYQRSRLDKSRRPTPSAIETEWQGSVQVAFIASNMLEQLANSLRAKAGMEPLDVATEAEAEMAKSVLTREPQNTAADTGPG
jgi:hypothetical protein